MTTRWPQWPYMTSAPYNDKNDGGMEGVMYLWSPLAIFCVVLGLLVALALIVALAVMIYNYCTYGMCCCPSCGGGQGCSMGPMCCCFMQEQEKSVVIDRRRGSMDSRCSGGSVRGRRPRIIVDDGRSGDDDDDIVVSRSGNDRKVRINDATEVHTIKVRRPASELSLAPQNLPQQPIFLQPQIIVQPPAAPPQQRCQPQGGFQGGELRVVIGNGGNGGSGGNYQQQRSSSKPLVFNMANNQRNEYMLTSVDGGGVQSGNGGFSGGNGFSGGIEFSSGNGFYGGGDSKGCGCQDDRASSFSDGQRSAIIDIGHGTRNSFYPSLPRYDE